MTYLFKPMDGGADQHLAVSSSAVQATAITNPQPSHVLVQAQGADVRVTFDGGTPSASNGMQMPALTAFVWHYTTLSAAKFIKEGSTDAVVYIQPLVYA